MTTPVIICDDSSVARKQMARSLPAGWDVDVTFASNGEEALEAIAQGKGDVMFLDLNMPVMDGYQTLEALSRQDLPCMVIVVSGDIQPDAHRRVTALGALSFIKKPINGDELQKILLAYGIVTDQELSGDAAAEKPKPATASSPAPVSATAPEASGDLIPYREHIQEITNVAMGQAAALMARHLNVFIKLPIPNVNLLEVSELAMALKISEEQDTVSAVCQGFIGSGIAGEALLIFSDSSFQDMASLLNIKGEIDGTIELELLMDTTSLLVGACLSGIAKQLDISFSQGHPVVLGQHVDIDQLIMNNATRWKRTLAIEISYEVENYDIHCDLLLLLTEDSIEKLNTRLSYLT